MRLTTTHKCAASVLKAAFPHLTPTRITVVPTPQIQVHTFSHHTYAASTLSGVYANKMRHDPIYEGQRLQIPHGTVILQHSEFDNSVTVYTRPENRNQFLP